VWLCGGMGRGEGLQRQGVGLKVEGEAGAVCVGGGGRAGPRRYAIREPHIGLPGAIYSMPYEAQLLLLLCLGCVCTGEFQRRRRYSMNLRGRAEHHGTDINMYHIQNDVQENMKSQGPVPWRQLRHGCCPNPSTTQNPCGVGINAMNQVGNHPNGV